MGEKLYREEKKSSKKWFLIIIGGVILILGVIVFFGKFGNEKNYFKKMAKIEQMRQPILVKGIDYGFKFIASCDNTSNYLISFFSNIRFWGSLFRGGSSFYRGLLIGALNRSYSELVNVRKEIEKYKIHFDSLSQKINKVELELKKISFPPFWWWSQHRKYWKYIKGIKENITIEVQINEEVIEDLSKLIEKIDNFEIEDLEDEFGKVGRRLKEQNKKLKVAIDKLKELENKFNSEKTMQNFINKIKDYTSSTIGSDTTKIIPTIKEGKHR